MARRLLVLVPAWLLPAWPAVLLVQAGGMSRRATAFLLAWATLAAVSVLLGRRGTVGSLYAGAMALTALPFLLASCWRIVEPVPASPSVNLLAVGSLLPLTLTVAWAAAGTRTARWRWSDGVAVAVSSAVGLILCEGAGQLLASDPFHGGLTMNSPDRSYWYIVRRPTSTGGNMATTFGFLGREPAPTYAGQRVLLIGDSIPAPDRPINFPAVAQAQLDGARIEIVNAAIAGYSLKQIERFYAERLTPLRHDIVIVSFYVDDINRELRYRRRNYLYTPSWPEWMQDVYYRCVLCKALLQVVGFTDNVFLYHRPRTLAESLPAALESLDTIRRVATQHGASIGVLNIPAFSWSGTLADAAAYRFADVNLAVAAWARDRRVPYHDVLPALVGADIRRLRISDSDIHFNDEGHRLVGAELRRLIIGMTTPPATRVSRP